MISSIYFLTYIPVFLALARPRITLHTGPTYVAEKTNVTLPKCHVTGFPPPQITWSKDPGSLPALSMIHNGQLKVANTIKQDSGLYKCQASNLLGSNVATTHLVVVPLPQFIIKPPEVLIVYTGDDVLATCSAKEDPGLLVTWSKSKGKLPTGRSQILANGTLLKIRDAVKEDAGRYICTASVGIFRSHAVMQLNVKVKRKFSVSRSKL